MDILQQRRRLKHRVSSSSSNGASSSSGKNTVSNHRRFQRGKKRWFLLHNGFLRFMVRSKFKFVLSSSGGRMIFQANSNNKRYEKKQIDHSDSPSVSSSSSHGSNSSSEKKTVFDHRRFQRGKKRRFLLRNGFLRFLVPSKFKSVLSSSGGRKIIGKHRRPHRFRLPHKIAKKLSYPQIHGLKWLISLYRKGRGGILADDVDHRETAVQICCFIAGLFYSNLSHSVLIVTKKNLLSMWQKELLDVELPFSQIKWDFTFYEDQHTQLQDVNDKVVYLTTYDLMANSIPKDAGKYEALDYLFLDEGHCIKNRNTELAKSLSRLRCLHRIIITTTPLQNNLKELWALFQFCAPGLIGYENEFVNKYGCICRVVEEKASISEQRSSHTAARALRKSIRPYFLRRTKSDFGIQLPKKNEMVIWLKLTPIQRQMYKDFLKNMKTSSENHLSALLVLKQICDHPLLVKGVAKDVLPRMDTFVDGEPVANLMQDNSCKISFISSLLNDLHPKGHFILIFSWGVKMLDLIEDFLKKHIIEFARLDGKTEFKQREKLVKDFQEGNGPHILLLTSGVGGRQLTLTKADRVILVNPAWNPCTDNQCVDRAYRIGQTKDVIVYRLITCGTIEEKIYIKQVLKDGLFRSITENKVQPRYFNTEDSQDIYSLPIEEAFDSSQAALQLLKQQGHQHTMEASLQQHVKFLHTLDIAGVTNHSTLFSDTVPVQGDVVEREC